MHSRRCHRGMQMADMHPIWESQMCGKEAQIKRACSPPLLSRPPGGTFWNSHHASCLMAHQTCLISIHQSLPLLASHAQTTVPSVWDGSHGRAAIMIADDHLKELVITFKQRCSNGYVPVERQCREMQISFGCVFCCLLNSVWVQKWG